MNNMPLNKISLIRIWLLLAIVLSSFLCQSCCTCTLKNCSDEEVAVSVTDLSGGNFSACSSLTLRWTDEDMSGEVVDAEMSENVALFRIPGRDDREDGQLIDVDSKTIQLQMLCDEYELFSETFEIEWHTFKCNECSGPAWCDDDYSTTGAVNVEVDPSLFVPSETKS